MDKINIVSSQSVLEVSSFSMDTRISSSLLVNSLVKIDCLRPHQISMSRQIHFNFAVSIHPHYKFVCGRHDAA